MAANPLLELKALGQSVWLDNLTRNLVRGGGLARLNREDGVSGVTSNPAIFHKAITGSDAYDGEIRRMAAEGKSALQIYEALAIEDIRGACDVLRSEFDATNGLDGYVSLEVSPHLARDAARTIAEAARLWDAVGRENLMIKIPGTAEALGAIEETLARGINVNVTLLFSLDAYRAVMEAHLAALERRMRSGQAVASVASVASFFLSRIDTMIDADLDAMIAAGDRADRARAARGRAAVASAKLAYELWASIYSGPRWDALRAAGARVQRPLWASTSTKDPAYPDVKYVEPLIGPNTVNTMPDATVDAFRGHGTPARTIELDLDGERSALAELDALGVDLRAVTDVLVEEGIRKFIEPFDALLAALEGKRAGLAPSKG